MQKIASFFLIVLLCSLMVSTVYGDDWLTWRGPKGDGISNEATWNPKALMNTLNTWETNIGKGHSAVAVKGNYLYTMGNFEIALGDDKSFEDVVYCLHSKTGKEIWRYSYPCKDGQDPGPGTTPVINEDHLYTLSREGHLFCFHAESGNIVWRRNIIADSLIRTVNWGFAGSPVIYNDLLLISGNKYGVAFDKNTGKIIWASDKEKGSFATPMLFNFGNRQLAAISNDKTLYIYEVETGKLKWSLPWESRCTDAIIYDENKIFLTGSGLALYELSENSEPKKIWDNRRINSNFMSWVVIDGYGYGLSWVRRNQHLRCIDLKTGELKWSEDMGQNGSIIAADKKIIVITGHGKLVVVDSNPDEFKEIASADLIQNADNTGVNNRRQCHCWINPVLANGFIYVRNTYGDLIAVDVKE